MKIFFLKLALWPIYIVWSMLAHGFGTFLIIAAWGTGSESDWIDNLVEAPEEWWEKLSMCPEERAWIEAMAKYRAAQYRYSESDPTVGLEEIRKAAANLHATSDAWQAKKHELGRV